MKNVEEIKTEFGTFAIDSRRDQKMANALRGEFPNKEMLSILKKLLGGGIFVDIGAHIGVVSIPMVKFARKVIAFEPSFRSLEFFRKNMTLNGSSIDLRAKALGSKKGEMSLGFASPNNAGSQELKEGFGVDVSTLDQEDVFADVIKIDVEGMEMDVFSGGLKSIGKTRPAIFFEMNLPRIRERNIKLKIFNKFFKELNYDFFIPLGEDLLGKVADVRIASLLLYPRATFFKTDAAPFDLVALPKEKIYPIKIAGFFETFLMLFFRYLKLKKTQIFGKKGPKGEIKKFLTFRASSIGDCLMARYLLQNVHLKFPKARVGVVVGSRGEMIKSLFKNDPWLEVLETNRKDPAGLLKLWIRYRGSDVVVTQYAGKHGGEFGLGSKIAGRILAKGGGFIGFFDVSRWNKFLYDKILPVRADWPVVEHEREALRVSKIGISIDYPKIDPVKKSGALEKRALSENKYIVLHFFSGSIKRGLSMESARSLIAHLRKQHRDTKFVLSGGAMDRGSAKQIAQGFSNVYVIAGDASLEEMMEIIYFSCGVISVDTGIAHISAHFRKPLIVLRTCLGPNWWFPGQYGPDAPIIQFSMESLCRPHVHKNYPDCLNKIDFEKVAILSASHITKKV